MRIRKTKPKGAPGLDVIRREDVLRFEGAAEILASCGSIQPSFARWALSCIMEGERHILDP